MFLLLILLRAWTSLPERQDYLGGSIFTLNCRIRHTELFQNFSVLVSCEQREHQRVTKPKAPALNLACPLANSVLDWAFPSLFWKVENKRSKKGKGAQSSILFLLWLVCLGFSHWPLPDQDRLQCFRNRTEIRSKGDIPNQWLQFGFPGAARPFPWHSVMSPIALLTETTHKTLFLS